jgi:Holliday junction resolvase RusA-like endonuclease
MRGRKLVDVCVPEVWTYYNGEWEKRIWAEVKKQLKEQVDEKLSVKLEFFLRKNRYESKNDVDNMIKTVFDILASEQHRPEYPIYDDYLIYNVEATKIPTEGDEKTHIQIWEWKS